MIAYLRGSLELKSEEYIIIEVQGIGYKVYMSKNNASVVKIIVIIVPFIFSLLLDLYLTPNVIDISIPFDVIDINYGEMVEFFFATADFGIMETAIPQELLLTMQRPKAD